MQDTKARVQNWENLPTKASGAKGLRKMGKEASVDQAFQAFKLHPQWNISSLTKEKKIDESALIFNILISLSSSQTLSISPSSCDSFYCPSSYTLISLAYPPRHASLHLCLSSSDSSPNTSWSMDFFGQYFLLLWDQVWQGFWPSKLLLESTHFLPLGFIFPMANMP